MAAGELQAPNIRDRDNTPLTIIQGIFLLILASFYYKPVYQCIDLRVIA
jgi:hypothetical protein